MAKKPTFEQFVDDMGPEMYYMDGELTPKQAARYWRQVYNSRYGRKRPTASLRSNVMGLVTR